MSRGTQNAANIESYVSQSQRCIAALQEIETKLSAPYMSDPSGETEGPALSPAWLKRMSATVRSLVCFVPLLLQELLSRLTGDADQNRKQVGHEDKLAVIEALLQASVDIYNKFISFIGK